MVFKECSGTLTSKSEPVYINDLTLMHISLTKGARVYSTGKGHRSPT